MTDIDAPRRYAEPVADRTGEERSTGLVVVLALALAVAAVSLAVLSREMAEPFVLAILAALAVVGVFCLFAGAVGILHFGRAGVRNDITKAFVDNLPQGALIADTHGRVLYANQAYLDLLGLEPDAGVLAPDRAFAGNAYLAEQIFRLARAVQQGRALREEFRLPPPGEDDADGKVSARWFRISVQPMPTDPSSGRRKKGLVVWQVEEVTADRERQEAGFEKLQAAIASLDNAPAGFFTADSEGTVDYLNATLAHWLGLDLADIAARPVKLAEIMSPDGAALIARAGRGTSPATGAAHRFDIDLFKADGTTLPVRILHCLARHGGGRAQALVLNRAPGEIEEAGAAELRFARFFNSAPIAIATVDGAGTISATNAAFMRLFGPLLDATQAHKIELASLADAEGGKALAKALAAALAAGKGHIEPVDVALAGGKERSVCFYLSPVERAEGESEAAIAYAIDTTEQRALEMQIAQSQKMQAVGQLAGGIAHDFNNMLTAIIGFSDFLLMNHRPTDPAFQDIMNIKQNANRAAGLVRQLLAFSRQQTLRLERLQLGDVLSDLSILLGRLLDENIELKLESGSDLWPVKTDLNQFEQVIINLAVNARDAMPGGGRLVIRTSNVPDTALRAFGQQRVEPGDYVMIEVIDTGTGMPPEVQAKMFEPFFSTKEVGRGTGLGLSTVYGIVRQTGGYIFAESEEGKGTTMRVFLPRALDVAGEGAIDEAKSGEAEEKRQERRETPRDLTGRGTVLLVEDEDAVRSFAARALGQRGYQVLQAATGTEALDLFAAHYGAVDLVVSDVVMPEMDGPTLMKRLRSERPGLKIIFISGYAEDVFRKTLAENDDFMFLQKPFGLKELAAAVKAALQD